MIVFPSRFDTLRGCCQLTSIAAPAASGWSGCRLGLAPTGKRRLTTAHPCDEIYPLIASLIRAERTHRQARSISYRIGGAKFPVLKDLDTFVFGDTPVDEGQVRELATGTFPDAKRDAAQVLRLDRLGTIAAAKEADLIVLNANPLDDIANTRKIERVYLRGQQVPRAELKTRWQAGLAAAAK